MKIPNWLLPLLSILLIAFLLTKIDLQATGRALASADLKLAFLAAGFTIASLCLKTFRWKLLLAEKHAIDFKELFPVQAAGIAASNFSPGKMLEAVKVVPLKQRGVPYSFGLLTVFWERALDLIVLFAIALTALGALGEQLRWVLLGLLGLLLALVIVMFRYYAWLLGVAKKFVKIEALQRVEPHSFKMATLLEALAVSVLAWFCDGATMYFAFLSVGLSYGFLHLVSAYFASIIVGVVSFLPGGLGSLEASLVLLLAPAKEALPLVVSAIVIGRIASLGVSSLLGFAMLPMVKKEEKEYAAK